MKAIAVKQPWAWLLANGYKDIENRTWNTKHRGQILIHASAVKASPSDYLAALEICRPLGIELPGRDDLPRGGIIGVMTVSGVTMESDSPWFFGPVGWQVHSGRPLPFRQHHGRLSTFESGLEIHVREEDGFEYLAPVKA